MGQTGFCCLCMILKNARLQLPATLDALEPLWESAFLGQAIFVDTGSEDETVSYLQRRFGDTERVHIHRLAWSGDFSVARNTALAQVNAAQTPWVLFLDADEHLTAQGVTVLQHWKEALSQQRAYDWPEALVCVRENLNGQGEGVSRDYLTRLWQASPQIRYVGRIHERPVYFCHPDQARPLRSVALSPAFCLHHLAADPAVNASKKALYFEALAQARLETPSPYLDYHWVISEQVQQHYTPHERLQVLQQAMQATQTQEKEGQAFLPEPTWAGVPWAAAILEAQYLWVEAGTPQAMIPFLSQRLRTQPEQIWFAESWGQLAWVYVEQQQFSAALGAFYRCLNPDGAVCDPSLGWHTWRCHSFLAALYQRLGDFPAAWCHMVLAMHYVLPGDFHQALQQFQRELTEVCARDQAVLQLQQSLQRARAAQDQAAMGWLSCFLGGIQGRFIEIQEMVWERQADALQGFRRYLWIRQKQVD